MSENESTRRTFLKHASVGAVAAGVVVAAAPALTDSASASPAAPAAERHPLDSGPSHDGAFTVWVKDARSGELAVLVGEQELVYHDRTLARRLARIAARAQRQS